MFRLWSSDDLLTNGNSQTIKDHRYLGWKNWDYLSGRLLRCKKKYRSLGRL